MAPTGEPDRPERGYDPQEEVRFAVVLYGGVSLAIYMNGVVRELFNLVRASAPELDEHGDPTGALHVPDAELTPVQRCYRELARLDAPAAGTAGEAGDEVTAGPDGREGSGDATGTRPPPPVRRRFVVDIISGSSAGGINGVFLAKALANEQEGIDDLTGLWVSKGDFATLLNDRRSRRGRSRRLEPGEPVDALFSGDIMYLELLDALDDMDGPGGLGRPGPDHAAPSAFVEELDLWVTATDLEGLRVPIQLVDQQVSERRHRHVFHFVFGEAQMGTDRRNDFVAGLNPILAFAARATSSFPFAFRPVQLEDISRVVRRDAFGGGRPDPRRRDWRPWFRPWLGAGAGDTFTEVSFGDGGDIDNKPFGWAIDTLPSRTAAMPVDRWLLYVEPDPEVPEATGGVPRRPNVIESTSAAVSLGRVEGIRDDLTRLAQRSELRKRIGRVVEEVELRVDMTEPAASGDERTRRWLEESGEDMAARGPAYAAYFRLRVDTLMKEFARSLSGLPWHEADTPTSAAAERLVAAWVEDAYRSPLGDDDEEDGDPDRPTTKEFLRAYDIAFRIRRLVFLAGRADGLMRKDRDQLGDRLGSVAPEGAPNGAPGEALDDAQHDVAIAELRRLKSGLGAVEAELRRYVPSIRSNRDPAASPAPRLEPPEVAEIMSSEGAAAKVFERRAGEMRPYVEGIAEYLDAVFDDARDRVAELLDDADGLSPGAAAARASLRRDHARFPEIDEVLFPLQVVSGVTGEVDPVQVARVSPREARRLQRSGEDPVEHPHVVGGRLMHFGAFVDESWRRNDIMWGRLDTAERLVGLLVPTETGDGPDEDLARRRGRLRDDLLDAILLEESPVVEDPAGPVAYEDLGTTPGARLDRFRDRFEPPGMPPTKDVLDLVARSGQVTSGVAESIGAPDASDATRRGAAMLHRLLASVAWVVSGLAALFGAREAISTPVRTAGLVSCGLGGVLVAAGAVFGWDGGSATGWMLVGIGAALLVLSMAFFLARRSVWLAIGLLAAVAVAGLAVYGGIELWSQRPEWMGGT